MRKILSLIVTLLWFILAPALAKADIRVTLELEKKQAYMLDKIQMKVKVSGIQNLKSDPVISHVNDLSVSPIGNSRYNKSLGGKKISILEYSYQITPAREGLFKIGPAQINIDDHDYTSDTETLIVYKKTIETGEKQGAAFLTATISKTECYVEEQLVYTARLYHQIEYLSIMPKVPEVAGLLFVNLGEPLTFEKIYNNKTYQVTAFRYAVFPSREGRFNIPPFQVELRNPVNPPISSKNGVSNGRPHGGKWISENRLSLYGDDIDISNPKVPKGQKPHIGRKILTGDVMELDVLPLPEKDRPEGFAGLVGRFEISASLNPVEIAEGQSTLLEVEIDGRGNVDYIPELDWPVMNGTKAYVELPVMHKSSEGDSIQGRKILRWEIVALKEGLYSVPAFSISYFNPDSGKYHISETSPLQLKVNPNRGIPELTKQEKISAGQSCEDFGIDILTIHDSVAQLSQNPINMPNDLFFWLILGMPLFASAVVFTGIHHHRNGNRDSIKSKARTAYKKLVETFRKSDISNKDISLAVCRYFNDRFSLSMASLTAEEAREVLTSKGITHSVALKFMAVFGRVEKALYSGDAGRNDGIQKDILQLVSEIENKIQI